MNKYLIRLIPLALACFLQGAQAADLSIKLAGDSSTLTTTVGTEFDANIFINSIGDFAGFDLTLSYDKAKLSALALTSGGIFGVADTETFSGIFTPGSGTVNVAEAISSTSPATVGRSINAPTLVATIHFKALTVGVNNLLSITDPILSDFGGNSIGGNIQTAFITIEPLAAVPLPASFLMFAPGLLTLCLLKRSEKVES